MILFPQLLDVEAIQAMHLSVSCVYIFRKRFPDKERPYKVIGYPAVPAITILLSMVVLVTTLLEDPKNSVIGVAVPLLGWAIYHLYFKKQEKKIRDTEK